MTHFPKTIYKYYPPTENALAALREHAIYFGVPANFNDPYDCAYVPPVESLSEDERSRLRAWIDKQPEVVMKSTSLPKYLDITRDEEASVKMANFVMGRIREQNSQHIRVACFSERHDNVSMWAHYGAHGTGFCLEFCTGAEPFDPLHLMQVQYKPQPPYFNFVDVLESPDASQHFIDLVTVKSCDWSHEKEWRMMTGKRKEKVLYPHNALKAVFLGVDINPKIVASINDILKEHNSDIKPRRGKLSNKEYRVCFPCD